MSRYLKASDSSALGGSCSSFTTCVVDLALWSEDAAFVNEVCRHE